MTWILALFAAVGGGCVYNGLCTLPCADRASYPSRYCLTCHDGSVMPSVEGHPLDVPYEGAPPPPPAIVLQDGGIVACTSCHNYWAVPRQPAWAAITMAGSKLCLACH